MREAHSSHPPGSLVAAESSSTQQQPQFLAILRTIFPKLAVPLRKEADQRSVQFSHTRIEAYKAPLFSAPARAPLTRDRSSEADPAHMWLRAKKPGLPWGSPAGIGPPGTFGLALGKQGVGDQRPGCVCGPGLRIVGLAGLCREVAPPFPRYLHLLLRSHPRFEVHAGPAGPPPGGVLRDLRIRGRRLGWRRGRSGSISSPRAPAARVSHQVVHLLGARTAGQEGEEVSAAEEPPLPGCRHVARATPAGPARPPDGPARAPPPGRGHRSWGRAPRARALSLSWGRGRGRRRGRVPARWRSPGTRPAPGKRQSWKQGPDARVMAAPLGLVPRPDPDLRRPGLRSRFLHSAVAVPRPRAAAEATSVLRPAMHPSLCSDPLCPQLGARSAAVSWRHGNAGQGRERTEGGACWGRGPTDPPGRLAPWQREGRCVSCVHPEPSNPIACMNKIPSLTSSAHRNPGGLLEEVTLRQRPEGRGISRREEGIGLLQKVQGGGLGRVVRDLGWPGAHRVRSTGIGGGWALVVVPVPGCELTGPSPVSLLCLPRKQDLFHLGPYQASEYDSWAEGTLQKAGLCLRASERAAGQTDTQRPFVEARVVSWRDALEAHVSLECTGQWKSQHRGGGPNSRQNHCIPGQSQGAHPAGGSFQSLLHGAWEGREGWPGLTWFDGSCFPSSSQTQQQSLRQQSQPLPPSPVHLSSHPDLGVRQGPGSAANTWWVWGIAGEFQTAFLVPQGVLPSPRRQGGSRTLDYTWQTPEAPTAMAGPRHPVFVSGAALEPTGIPDGPKREGGSSWLSPSMVSPTLSSHRRSPSLCTGRMTVTPLHAEAGITWSDPNFPQLHDPAMTTPLKCLPLGPPAPKILARDPHPPRGTQCPFSPSEDPQGDLPSGGGPAAEIRPHSPQTSWSASRGPRRGGSGCGLMSQSVPILPTDASLLAHWGRTGRGLVRLRLLETYLRALLVAGERLSRSPVLTGFFAPQPLDLEPALPPGRCLTHPQLPAGRNIWKMGEVGWIKGLLGGKAWRLGGLLRDSWPTPNLPTQPPLICTLGPYQPGDPACPGRAPTRPQGQPCQLQSGGSDTQDAWGQPFQARAQEALNVGLGRSLGTRPSAPLDPKGPQDLNLYPPLGHRLVAGGERGPADGMVSCSLPGGDGGRSLVSSGTRLTLLPTPSSTTGQCTSRVDHREHSSQGMTSVTGPSSEPAPQGVLESKWGEPGGGDSANGGGGPTGEALASVAPMVTTKHPLQGPSSVLPVPLRAAKLMSCQCLQGHTCVCWKRPTAAGGWAGLCGASGGGGGVLSGPWLHLGADGGEDREGEARNFPKCPQAKTLPPTCYSEPVLHHHPGSGTFLSVWNLVEGCAVHPITGAAAQKLQTPGMTDSSHISPRAEATPLLVLSKALLMDPRCYGVCTEGRGLLDLSQARGGDGAGWRPRPGVRQSSDRHSVPRWQSPSFCMGGSFMLCHRKSRKVAACSVRLSRWKRLSGVHGGQLDSSCPDLGCAHVPVPEHPHRPAALQGPHAAGARLAQPGLHGSAVSWCST
ncbi:NADPH oxidase organizer 1 [Camelus dromedarius]|uniref:NADPH oxidase organizer 1 n=1 Tax=Camelus dromedarius TaxID=9838 RepID=A0A5N4BYY6_CAMDR|nr:NADPH oxidase organizer 1 [Camelus dromedarius]